MTDRFHPIVRLPHDAVVLDHTRGYDPNHIRPPFAIGRYDEKRPGMYTAEIFAGVRDVHVGIDLGAPAGTEVFAYDDGEIFLFADNAAPGDYGPTLITKHELDGRPLYVLLGHLSRTSLANKRVGDRFARGAVLGFVGSKEENGGWNPHVHVQLSWLAPAVPDMPGVVTTAERAAALERYPDPRLILGAIY
jgi:peptidoglycan LD-endopeptidase LytH